MLTKCYRLFYITIPPFKNRKDFTQMPRVRKRTKYEPEPLDQELFQELLHILHHVCFNGNWAQTSRAVGVSRPTAMRWVNSPPTMPHWNVVLREVLKIVIADLKLSPHRSHRKRARQAMQRLNTLPQVQATVEQMKDNDRAQDGAVKELLIYLNETPGQSASTKTLRQQLNYSTRTLRAAAKTLNLDIEVEGFGEEKTVYYSMPRSTT